MTTKIQFKLSNDVLLTVIQMVEKTDDYVVQSIKDALLVSIKEDLLAKLEDKAKNIQKQVSILDHNKKHAIVLKYHEAYTMYKLLELVYEKETFADHPHIKKIKRLLVDLENKVESFTTENKTADIAEADSPDHVNFPSLGVNEIIIEEATILEGESCEDLQDDNNPVLDSTIDVNEIVVHNYSIFDLLEETPPTDATLEETESNEIEGKDESITVLETVVHKAEETVVAADPAVEEELASPQEETPTEELPTLTAKSETLTTGREESILEEETKTELQEEAVATPSWAQQVAPPVFDGIVTKTSICIESEDPFSSDCPTKEGEEETLNLFEEETLTPVQSQDDKGEKEVKKEKKKPVKDNSQQGQISLF
ncbi:MULTISPECIES: hypothetical protein [unclassified Myroides]|uniref:hypothetical protein n=1 Tax=unclassified Myroides TaxID=2642485 RepID=UPI003D2F531E